MFDHVTLGASDRDASRRFYETLLPTLGIEDWQDFRLVQAEPGHGVTRALHIGFVAPSRAAVDEFWRVGTQAGYRDDGAPGARPEYGDDYYGSFLRDPDGNSAEAVHHGNLRRGGVIDHLWIRVADVEAAKAFYEGVAPHGGFRLMADTPGRAQFAAESGSFSVVAGTPSRHVHMAFPGNAESFPPARDPDGNHVEIVGRG